MKNITIKSSLFFLSLFISGFLFAQVGDVDAAGKIKESGNELIPAGAIIMWSANVIPNGWVICDGNNGTPDLTDKFIRGSLTAHVNETGGSVTHNHTIGHYHEVNPPNTPTTSDTHTHTHLLNNYIMDGPFTMQLSDPLSNDTHHHDVDIPVFDSEAASSPNSSTDNHLPPYYKLIFIMKI